MPYAKQPLLQTPIADSQSFHPHSCSRLSSQQRMALKAALAAAAIVTFLAVQSLVGAISVRIFGSIAATVAVLLTAPLSAAAIAAVCTKVRRMIVPTPIEVLYVRYGMPLPPPKALKFLRRR